MAGGLYEALISCDIERVTVTREKLQELEDSLAALGKGEAEVSAVLDRFDHGARADLGAVDQELEALRENLEGDFSKARSAVSAGQDGDAAVPVWDDKTEWDHDRTDVEVLDTGEDDFVLLVEEQDLEELPASAEEAAPQISVPPPIPSDRVGENVEGGEGDEGFFQKLFGSRRSSNRP